jgi:hypothetical protein
MCDTVKNNLCGNKNWGKVCGACKTDWEYVSTLDYLPLAMVIECIADIKKLDKYVYDGKNGILRVENKAIENLMKHPRITLDFILEYKIYNKSRNIRR